MVRLRAALVAAVLTCSIQIGVADARPITLAEALALAERSPTLVAAAATVDAARGNLEQAGAYTYNPAIGASVGRARSGGATFYDFEVGISQAIELGGKRGARRDAATAERDAAAYTLGAARNAVNAEVRRAFDAALVAQARVDVTTEAETWAHQFREAAAERMRLGAATQTEVNVAVANLGRSIAARKAAERDRLLARQALGDVLGLAGAELEPSGPMPGFGQASAADEERVVAAALEARGDLAAADRTRAARSADVDLADAQAVPDPELSLSWARDAVDEANTIVAGVRIELPLWNRNVGGRHAARAVLKRATIERDALRLGVERDVRSSLRRYQAAVAAVAAFDQQVVGKLSENLTLARETLAAGKLGLLEVNTVRRDLVDSQLAYLDAIAEAVEARAALERALGRSPEGTL